jgi:teichuronic acid biosynthesis glycosyltransferase TuaC
VPVHYPRFVSVPGILKPLDGLFLFLSVWHLARKLRRDFDFDLIDSHLAYPDGFGCALLARVLNKPLTVTLRGHDINVFPKHPVRRRQIQFTLRAADKVIAVADALRRGAVALGCPGEKTVTIPNGVDAELFYPGDGTEARRRLDLPLERRIVLSIGHICERKGFHLLVRSLAGLKQEFPDTLLVIAGEPGAEPDHTAAVERTIRELNLGEDVVLVGAHPNHLLRDWYNAADVFCLASSKEGWANVLLESLACGTPVVATRVWGTPEVISSDEYGILVERTPEEIGRGLSLALRRSWDRKRISEYARSRTWDVVAGEVTDVFDEILGPES